MLMLFNLLPCFPMDGGRVLRALLAFAFGRLRATEIAANVGLFMAFLLAASAVILPVAFSFPVNPMLIVVAMFVLFAGQYELWGVRQLEARRRAARMAPLVPQVEPAPTGTATTIRAGSFCRSAVTAARMVEPVARPSSIRITVFPRTSREGRPPR